MGKWVEYISTTNLKIDTEKLFDILIVASIVILHVNTKQYYTITVFLNIINNKTFYWVFVGC